MEIVDVLYPNYAVDKRRDLARKIQTMAAELKIVQDGEEVPPEKAALEYITSQVLEGEEMRVAQMHEMLTGHDRYGTGRFTLGEFHAVLMTTVPDDGLVRRIATRLYRMSARTMTGSASSSVPVERLAIILALLSLRALSASKREVGGRGEQRRVSGLALRSMNNS